MADRLVFNLEDRTFGFHTECVDKVVEMDQVFFMPGSSGILSGIISLSGEPVAVVDARKAVGVKPLEPAAGPDTHRIVVVRDSERMLGYDLGPTEVSFLLEDDTADETSSGGIEIIDWTVDYDKTIDILEGPNA